MLRARVGGVVQASRALVNARIEMRIEGSIDLRGGERARREVSDLRPWKAFCWAVSRAEMREAGGGSGGC